MTTRRTSTGTTISTAKSTRARRKSPPPKSVAEAASSGTQRELLVAVRDRIALTVSDPKCPPRDLASLTRRLDDVVEKIEALDARDRAEQEAEEAGATEDGDFDASAV